MCRRYNILRILKVFQTAVENLRTFGKILTEKLQDIMKESKERKESEKTIADIQIRLLSDFIANI